MAIAIDPPYCGCTECLTLEYVPLNKASTHQIVAMLNGELGNNTGCVTGKELLDAVEDCNLQAYDTVFEFLVR